MSKKSDMFPEASFQDGLVFDFFKPRSAAFQEFYDFGPSLTRQEFADECDINSIMARYETTGMLPIARDGAHFADYTQVPDLMGAMAVMSEAQSAFMTLPARVRKEFDNDPMQFVEFASDPANLDQMRSWGLAPPAPPAPPEAAPAEKPADKAGASKASGEAPKGD